MAKANARSTKPAKPRTRAQAKPPRPAGEEQSGKLEEIQQTIEELRVAEEEIRKQNLELQETRQQLELEKQRDQEFFQQAPDAYLVTDRYGEIQTANPAANVLLNVPPQHLAGKPLSVFITHPQMSEFQTRLSYLVRHPGRANWELRLKVRDGTEVEAEVTVAPAFSARGDLAGFRWLIRDVTERNLAAHLLAEQASLLDLAHDGIIVRLLDGTVLFWNHGAEEIYGWTPDQARGRMTHQLLQTVFPVSSEHVNSALLHTGRWEGELLHTRQDGSQLTVSSRQVLQLDAEGRPRAVLELNTDITAQKQAERELRALNVELEQRVAERTASLVESNLRIGSILASITDSYVALDPQGRIVELNSAAERSVFGRPREELLGRVMWDLDPDGEQAEFARQFQVAYLERQPVHFETYYRFADRWYEMHAYPEKDRLDVYLRDVTRRRAAEEEHAFLAAIVESSNDAIIGEDVQGHILSWSPGAERLFGYVEDEVRGKHISILYPPNGQAEFPQIIERLLRGERVEDAETVRVHRSGRPIDVRVSISPIRNADGAIVGIAKIVNDITLAKRGRENQHFLSEASAALSSSLDYHETLQSLARVVIPFLGDYCVLDVVEKDGSARRIGLTAADPALEGSLRELSDIYDSASVLGWIEREEPGRRPRIIREVSETLLGAVAPESKQLDLLRRLAPGSLMVIPIVARGRLLGLLSLATGPSGRRYDQDDLALAEDLARRAGSAIDNARLYQEAQAAIVARDQFLAVASHEFRTPLAVIQGYTQLLERQVESTPDSDLIFLQRELLERMLSNIDHASTRLVALVGDLLDIGRLRDQQMSISPERVNLSELLRRVIESVSGDKQRREQLRTLQLQVEMPERDVWGRWDRARLEQVVTNLVDNAIKYSSPMGTVEIKLELEREEDDNPADRCAHLTVQDEGIGIPSGDMQQMFQPFKRGSNAIALHYPGLGLGLALSREIVARHGGRIWVESEGPNQGSAFHVLLPAVE